MTVETMGIGWREPNKTHEQRKQQQLLFLDTINKERRGAELRMACGMVMEE